MKIGSVLVFRTHVSSAFVTEQPRGDEAGRARARDTDRADGGSVRRNSSV